MATKKTETAAASTEADTPKQTAAASSPAPAATTQASTTASTDSADVAPAPLGNTEGTGAPNAIDQSQASAAEEVVKKATGTDEDGEVAKEKVQKIRQVLGDVGVTPAPETVNGVSVVGKKLNDAGTEYVDDPDAQQAAGRGEDIFDRIAAASPNEGIRLVLEEIARLAGATSENTQELPEGTTGTFQAGKSTASLRKDLDDTQTTAPTVKGE